MIIVFDANCWAAYVRDILECNNDVGSKAFDRALKEGKIAFDEGGLIAQQYKNCTSGQHAIFQTFFDEQVIRGRVRIFNVRPDQSLQKQLMQIGVPKGEFVFFKTAVQSCARYLVSDDIDFFDPRKKTATAAVKQRLRSSSAGPVCNLMRKTHSVEIMCLHSWAA